MKSAPPSWRFPIPFASDSRFRLALVPVRRCIVVSAFAFAVAAAPLHAQESALIEILTPVLAAEDARAWKPEALRAALVYPDSFVRRTAAISIGEPSSSLTLSLPLSKLRTRWLIFFLP